MVAALGDGGALMGVSELETVVRLGLPMVVVVYDDEAYGAEVHHFGPDGYPLDTVRFPPVNIAKIAKGFGFAAAKVRQVSDLCERPGMARRPERPAAADRRQGHLGARLVVAGRSLPRPLTPPRGWSGHDRGRFSANTLIDVHDHGNATRGARRG